MGGFCACGHLRSEHSLPGGCTCPCDCRRSWPSMPERLRYERDNLGERGFQPARNAMTAAAERIEAADRLVDLLIEYHNEYGWPSHILLTEARKYRALRLEQGDPE